MSAPSSAPPGRPGPLARLAPHAPLARVTLAVGRASGAGLAALARLRRAKPIHPKGVVLSATLTLDAGDDVPGATELGAPRTIPATVRLSRSVGLPRLLPDVHGLAVRWGGPGRTEDLLFSTSGLGRVARFFICPRRTMRSGPYSTLWPLQTPDGPVMFAAVPSRRQPDGGSDVTDLVALEMLLLSARPGGPWQRLGRLSAVGAHPPSDAYLRFDPVAGAPRGFELPAWAQRLRAPAYRSAHRAWGEGSDARAAR